MKSTHLIVPMVALAAFAGYFSHWKSRQPDPEPAVIADPYAVRDGKKDAQAELAAGKLVLIESAAPMSWDRERREIALDKYGVELRSRPADATTEAFAKYADAFNRVMRPRIFARHGRGVFDALHRDAIALYESRRAQPKTDEALAPQR